MSVLKNTMLALVLGLVSSACVAQEEQNWTRIEYIEKCNESASKFKVPVQESNSVCNCAAQYVSWVASGGKTEWADFVIPMPNALAVDAIRYCRAAHASNPNLFQQKFGTLSVNNEETTEEGI